MSNTERNELINARQPSQSETLILHQTTISAIHFRWSHRLPFVKKNLLWRWLGADCYISIGTFHIMTGFLRRNYILTISVNLSVLIIWNCFGLIPKIFLKQESPPTWTQEAYRPQRNKYSVCCPILGRGVPNLAGGYLPWGTPSSWPGWGYLSWWGIPTLGYPPPSGSGQGTPPPPPGVDRLKTLPSPSFWCGQ